MEMEVVLSCTPVYNVMGMKQLFSTADYNQLDTVSVTGTLRVSVFDAQMVSELFACLLYHTLVMC